MAFTPSPVINVTYTFRDEGGSLGRMRLSLPASASLEEAITEATTMAGRIQAVTGASIIGYDVSQSVTQTAPVAAAADHLVEDKGKIGFLTAAGKEVLYSIPGFRRSLVNPDGSMDDAADVTALVGAVVSGDWVDSNGQNLTANVKGYFVNRSTSKRQTPSNRRIN
jgi:hypothetical protein